MMRIPKGEFQMGDPHGDDNEQYVRTVIFNKDFEIGQYEVTFAEYDLPQYRVSARQDALTFYFLLLPFEGMGAEPPWKMFDGPS